MSITTTTTDPSTMTFDPVAAFLRRPLNEVVGASLTELNASASSSRTVIEEKTIPALHKLAAKYAWVSVLDLTATLLAASDDNPSYGDTIADDDKQKVLLPHERILCSMYRALALLQTRQLDRASTAVQQLGDLSDKNPQYRYETYENHYPGLHGTFIPFELRMLQIEIRMRQGDFDAIYDAYELRNEICPVEHDQNNKPEYDDGDGDDDSNCKRKYSNKSDGNDADAVANNNDNNGTDINKENKFPSIDDNENNNNDSNSNNDNGGDVTNIKDNKDHIKHKMKSQSEDDIKKKRFQNQRLSVILSALASYHLKMGHSDAAVDIAGELTDLCGGMEAWYMYGRVLLHVGDFEECETAFQQADTEAEAERERYPERANEIDAQRHAHKAMLLGARGKYNEAVIEYDEAGHLARRSDTGNLTVVVANNAAICLMHVGRLAEAIDRLESVIRKGPKLALDEGLVFNLATLYDLAYPDSANEKKRVLHRLAERFSREGYHLESVGLSS